MDNEKCIECGIPVVRKPTDLSSRKWGAKLVPRCPLHAKRRRQRLYSSDWSEWK